MLQMSINHYVNGNSNILMFLYIQAIVLFQFCKKNYYEIEGTFPSVRITIIFFFEQISFLCHDKQTIFRIIQVTYLCHDDDRS